MTNTDNKTKPEKSSNEVSESKKIESVLYWTASAFLLAVLSYYVFRQCSILQINYDVGLIALGADVICDGGTLYSDIHTVMFPGVYLILAICFKLFGSSYLVCQVATTVVILIVGALTLTLSRKFINGWNVLLPAAITIVVGTYMNPYFSHHWCSILFALAFANCLCFLNFNSVSNLKNRVAAFCTGLIAGLSIICYQLQLFPILFCSVIAAYLLNFSSGYTISSEGGSKPDNINRQNNANFIETAMFIILGIASVLLFLLVSLFATGTLNDFIECTIKFVFSHYENVNKVVYGYNNVQESAICSLRFPLNLFSNMSFGIIKAAPFIVLIGCLCTLIQEKSLKRALTKNTQVTLLIVLAFGLFFGEAIHKPDLRRLVWAMPIMLIAVFYFGEQIQYKYKSAKILVVAASVMIAIGLVLNGKMFMLGKSFLAKNYSTNRGVVSAVTNLEVVEKVRSLVNPKDKILVYPYDTAIAYLSGGRFPSKFPVLHYRYHTKEQFQSVIDDMESSKVKYVIWNRLMDNKNFPELGWPNYKPVPDSELIMEPYLKAKYRPIKQYGNYLLMVRK